MESGKDDENGHQMRALVAFCEAEMDMRQMREASKSRLKELRVSKHEHMTQLLHLMADNNLACLSLPSSETAAPTYVRVSQAYNTRELSPSFVRCTLHDRYGEILTAMTPDDSGVVDVDNTVKTIMKILKESRTVTKPVVVISRKKPRDVDVTVIDADSGADASSGNLFGATQGFVRSKRKYDETVSSLKESRSLLRAQINSSMPIVHGYMSRQGQTSQAIVLSKNNNQKMFLREKVITRKARMPVLTVEGITHSVLSDMISDVREEGESPSPDPVQVMTSRKDDFIENIIAQMTAKQNVSTKVIIKLDKARSKDATGNGSSPGNGSRLVVQSFFRVILIACLIKKRFYYFKSAGHGFCF